MRVIDVVGKVVVLTGKFSEFARAEAEATLTQLGATVRGSISGETDILFVGARAGSKLAKARSLGVTVHDEPTLAALLAAAVAVVDAAPAAKPAKAEKPAKSAKSAPPPVAAFAGKTIALTGTFTTMKRADAKKVLVEAGATVAGGVTKKTDLLIHGDDAGSKLDKATSMGVALMTEAQMVALLTAGGAGKEQLAGADEKLAKKQAQDAASSTQMTAVAAELRAFVAALKHRKDIRVEVAALGRKAGKSKLAQLRAANIPTDLIDLYAEVDGVHVEWRFIEPPGGGRIRMPPATQWTTFGGEDDHYMGFGDDQEALLLDEVTPEGATYLVRETANPDAVRIVFASAAEGADGVIAANSIAAYMRAAMAHGGVYYWPRCNKKHPHVSYAEQELALERFQARPVTPSKIRVGQRVQFGYFSEGGRGYVQAMHEAPPGPASEFCGTTLAQIQLDEGSNAWLPIKWMKAYTKTDAYERLRDASFDLGAAAKADVSGLLDDLCRAIDPLTSYSTASFASVPNNARRAAGLLATRSLADAVTSVIELHAAATRAGLDFAEHRPLAQTGDEFSKPEQARCRWQYTASGMFQGLFGGLVLLALHESTRRGVPGYELLDAKLVKRLAKLDGASALHDRCTQKQTLPAPRWDHGSSDQAEALGLPAGAIVLAGTGY